jgi:hypothetical protein
MKTAERLCYYAQGKQNWSEEGGELHFESV